MVDLDLHPRDPGRRGVRGKCERCWWVREHRIEDLSNVFLI